MTGASRTPLVRVDPVAPDVEVLRQAAGVLRGGGIIALPTETFYGLAVAAHDAAAVRRLFLVKGRPAAKPVLVLLDTASRLDTVAVDVSPAAMALMARHWPGPLTLVFRAAARVPVEVTAATGTVGVRVPAHAVARGLVHALDAPITAPSANPSGQEPPTTAAGVLAYLDGAIDLVLDGGPTTGGPPSTVLDTTVTPPRLIRAGAVQP
jgi:L-threonylcarbamoyladenylate synthase